MTLHIPPTPPIEGKEPKSPLVQRQFEWVLKRLKKVLEKSKY